MKSKFLKVIIESINAQCRWVVLTHELLRTPRTPTNSYELPTFTKSRTPKNNIFQDFLKLLLSCCYVVAKIQICCCKQMGVCNNNPKYELQSLKKILKLRLERLLTYVAMTTEIPCHIFSHLLSNLHGIQIDDYF